MTLSQSARYNAYSLVLAHLKENESITKDVPDFVQIYEAARTKLDAIIAADNMQQCRENIAGLALIISTAIIAHADETNNHHLMRAMHFSSALPGSGRESQWGAKAATILVHAGKLATELKGYGITDEMMTSYAAMVEEYLTTARELNNNVKGHIQAGESIKKGLKELHEILNKQLDKLMRQFKFTHPAFYNGYISKRRLVTPAAHSTQPARRITDAARRNTSTGVPVFLKGTELMTVLWADGSYGLYLPLLTSASIKYQQEGMPLSRYCLN